MVTLRLGTAGNHATEQTNIMDAGAACHRRLEKKKCTVCAPILPPVGCAGMSGPVQWSALNENCWLTRRTKRCTN